MRSPEPSTFAARRPIPEHLGTRLEQAQAAVTTLREERRRLERLGLETPLARCHQQLRYWEFVTGLLSLAPLPPSQGR